MVNVVNRDFVFPALVVAPKIDMTTCNCDLSPSAKRQKTSDQSQTEINGNAIKDTPNGPIPTVVRKNQFGEVVTDPDISNDGWLKIWESGKTKFHKKNVHLALETYHSRLVQDKKDPTFFVPLCGKSVDMKWLLEQGYSVFGCDLAEEGVKQFFSEQGIDFTAEPLEDHEKCVVYKGKELPISIYVCDYFKLPAVMDTRFDCIWDRGSFAAINTKDRARYCDVMKQLLKPEGRWLLDVFELDHVTFAGPPFNQETEELKELIGNWCSLEMLRRKDAMSPWSKTWGVSYFIVKDFLITRKAQTEATEK